MARRLRCYTPYTEQCIAAFANSIRARHSPILVVSCRKQDAVWIVTLVAAAARIVRNIGGFIRIRARVVGLEVRSLQAVEFGDSLLDDCGVGVDLIRRVSSGAKSVANLIGRELGQKAADPLSVRARNVPADPAHVHTAKKLLGRSKVDQCWAGWNVEVNVLGCLFANELRVLVGLQVSLGYALRPTEAGGCKAGA